MRSLVDAVLRVAMTSIHALLKARKAVSPPKTVGAHAVALTPEGRIVLVKLRYARGWRVPGGGRSATEDPGDAALRELREEIGMTAHGSIERVAEFDEAVRSKRKIDSLYIVRDVLYRPPGWSWEVESVGEFDPDRLPSDLAGITGRWIVAIRHLL